MPRYRHPRALDGVAGHPPARVTLAGASVPISDGEFETDDTASVSRLAAAYDVDVADLSTAETCQVEKADGEVCGRKLPCPYHSEDDE